MCSVTGLSRVVVELHFFMHLSPILFVGQQPTQILSTSERVLQEGISFFPGILFLSIHQYVSKISPR